MRTRAEQNVPLASAAALALLMAGSMLANRPPGREPAARQRNLQRPKSSGTVLAARRLNRAAGTLAMSVLADSAVEHYRGSFKNKAMFTPLIVSALTLATSLHGTADM